MLTPEDRKASMRRLRGFSRSKANERRAFLIDKELVEGRVCPKCGRAILRNSREEWCARGQAACDYRAKVEGGRDG